MGDVLRYHVRRGQHDLTDYDWRQYLDFADRHARTVVPGPGDSAPAPRPPRRSD